MLVRGCDIRAISMSRPNYFQRRTSRECQLPTLRSNLFRCPNKNLKPRAIDQSFKHINSRLSLLNQIDGILVI